MSCNSAAESTKRFLLRLEPQGVRHLAGDAERPQGMLPAGMVRPGEHQVGQAQLVHAVQPLQLRPVHQVHEDALDPDGTVHAIVDDLEIWHDDKMELLLFKTHLIQARS